VQAELTAPVQEAASVAAPPLPAPAPSTPAPEYHAADDVPRGLPGLALFAEGFDFYRAVRLLECAHPDKPRVGTDNRANTEPVRFGQPPSLSFSPSTVAGYEPPADGKPPKLLVNFMGLLGPNGPMPLHMTAYVWDRLRNHRDPTLVRFLDLFNHRMIALFYRAWAHNQQALGLDRGGRDKFATYVGSFIGIGVESLMRRDAVADVAKLHYAGRLLCQTKNAEGLVAVLSDYFRVPVELEQFVGQWVKVPEESLCRLGESPDTGTLGSTAIVGSRVWDVQQKFRLRFGPLTYADYERMLPGGASLKRLVAWVRSYVGDEFDWDVQLVLKKANVPALKLGQGGRLGWSTWLHAAPPKRDAADLVLRPFAA
jgi:type VI secretion system protein ImpH